MVLTLGWALWSQGHRAVLCRFMIELGGDLGRARRPQAFRGLTKDESRRAPREESKNILAGGDGDSRDVLWRRWNDDAETYPKRKEHVFGRNYSERSSVGKHVDNTMSAPRGRG